MRTSNNVIVLSKIKYRDNDLIVKCYTKKRGVVSYLVKSAFKKKNTIAYFQLLSQLTVEENYKTNQSLHYLSELKLKYSYSTLHSNVLKSSIVIFLAEILSIILNEEEENEVLYNFLETTLLWLDNEKHFANCPCEACAGTKRHWQCGGVSVFSFGALRHGGNHALRWWVAPDHVMQHC